MSDWYIEVEHKIKVRNEAEAKRKAQEKARREKQQAAQQALEAERRLQEYKRKYKCHICGIPTSGPKTISEMVTNDGSYSPWYTTRTTPGGLGFCSICKKWACFERKHAHRGICQKCAEKGYLPGDPPKGREWVSSKIRELW